MWVKLIRMVTRDNSGVRLIGKGYNKLASHVILQLHFNHSQKSLSLEWYGLCVKSLFMRNFIYMGMRFFL